jgi:[ribosomal protein S5]-alanine N-acetyltransferase
LDLEPLSAGHAAELHAGMSDPGLYLHLPQEPPADLAATERRIDRLAGRGPAGGTEVWPNWLARRRDLGAAVGLVELTIAEDGAASIAWFVFAPHQREGFGREQVAAVTGAAFAIGVVRITALIDTRNRASIGLARAVGMRRLGMRRGADRFKGRLSDEFVYGLEAR